MSKMKYKVGDRVRVRQWEAMARQYKVRNDGDIEIIGTPHYFIKEKKFLCGQVVTIEKVASDYYSIKEDFISHMVQIILSSVFLISSFFSSFISHMVQIILHLQMK